MDYLVTYSTGGLVVDSYPWKLAFCIIGVSLSKPHTGELVGKTELQPSRLDYKCLEEVNLATKYIMSCCHKDVKTPKQHWAANGS